MLHIGGCGGGLLSSIIFHEHKMRIAWISVAAVVDADAAAAFCCCRCVLETGAANVCMHVSSSMDMNLLILINVLHKLLSYVHQD